MKEKTEAILGHVVGWSIVAAVFGVYIYLINEHDKAEYAMQTACTAIVSKAFSNSGEGRLAAETVCNSPCMYTSVDELVNGYGLKEPSEIYRMAKTKCKEELK